MVEKGKDWEVNFDMNLYFRIPIIELRHIILNIFLNPRPKMKDHKYVNSL